MSAPIKGTATSANPTPGSNFKSQNHNQNTGSDGFIIAMFTMSNARSYTGCTYGGVSMTQLYQINRGGLSQRMVFYYLANPPTGTNALRVNFNGSVWNPISMHIRSFTNCEGIGSNANTGGTATPNTQNLTVSQDDSLVMMSSCSVNQVLTQQIPTGSNKAFTTHNTNRQVATGAISANAGESAGVISLRSTCTFGNLTLDRIEIKGIGSAVDTSGGDFFAIM